MLVWAAVVCEAGVTCWWTVFYANSRTDHTLTRLDTRGPAIQHDSTCLRPIPLCNDETASRVIRHTRLSICGHITI